MPSSCVCPSALFSGRPSVITLISRTPNEARVPKPRIWMRRSWVKFWLDCATTPGTRRSGSSRSRVERCFWISSGPRTVSEEGAADRGSGSRRAATTISSAAGSGTRVGCATGVGCGGSSALAPAPRSDATAHATTAIAILPSRAPVPTVAFSARPLPPRTPRVDVSGGVAVENDRDASRARAGMDFGGDYLAGRGSSRVSPRANRFPGGRTEWQAPPMPSCTARTRRYFFSSTATAAASLAFTVTGISLAPVNSCQATSV